MKVKEIMSKEPACCTRESSLQDVAILMVEHDCGEIPVVDNMQSKRPVGVVTDRDITIRTVALGKNPLELRARDCMSSPAVTVTPDTSLDDCCTLMEENQLRRVPVVDETGCCCGIVSQADIARHASKSDAGELVKDVSRKTHEGASRSPMTQA
jgi:CBS-domain-containing membrane protein